MNKLTRYAPEVRERAVRMVLNHQSQHSSQWVAITSVAGQIVCKAEMLEPGCDGSNAARGVGRG